MEKSHLREKVSRALRQLYDSTAEQPIPRDMLDLLDKLK